MSSTTKLSSDLKRSHLHHQSKIPDQYRAQVQQLQEFFPDWSVDGLSLLIFHLRILVSPPSPLDLISTLVDVGGDASLAATRITEGQYLALVSTYFPSFLYVRTRGAMGRCDTKEGQKNPSSSRTD
jgi:hypothetical protein